MYVIEPGHRENSSVMDAAGIYSQKEAAGGAESRTKYGFFLLLL